MKYKIKEILLILVVIFSPVALWAQSKEQSDTIKVEHEEKVNVLYGTQRYDRFVGNMDAVKGEDLKTHPAMMVQEALAGQLPGVFIMQNNGNPGEENFTTFIRGNVNGYITLVDGVERSLSQYDIEQIEEVRVLKDPVSKALYGGRISNGIIMVTTKRGKNMKSEFHAGFQKGVKMPTKLPEFLNAYDFATNYNKAVANDNNGIIPVGQGYTQDALDAYKNHTRPYQYPDVDYYGQFLNKSMDITRINTEYYGGSDKTKYYFHTGYQKEGGYETYGSYPRQMQAFNIQGNLDTEFSKYILLKANYAGYVGDKQYPGSFGIGTLSSRYPNAYPIFVASDSVGGTASYKDNPYGGQAQSGYTAESSIRMQSDLGFEFKLDKVLKGLSVKPNYSFDIYHRENRQKINTVGIYSISSFDDQGNPLTINTIQQPKLTTSQSLGDYDLIQRWGFTNTISYQREFRKHAIDADFVYYISDMLQKAVAYDYKRQNLGIRANYSYTGKYTLEGVLNYCGSQSYAPDKRFKYFPAIGAGWLISKENFMKNLSFVNFLKINGSWGIMGDGNITTYLWRENWAALGNPYYFNGSTSANVGSLDQVSNLGLDWPKERELDLSIEAKMFHRLNFKATYFDYLTYDQLSRRQNSIPSIIGSTNFLPQSNFGKTGLRGIEAEISYMGKLGDFSYNIGGHLTYSKSKKVIVDELPDPKYSTQGDGTDDIRGYQAIGIYTQSDIDQTIAGTLPQPSFMDPKALRVGNIMYKDINGDMVIDKYDQVVIGNSSPRLMYSGDIKLKYKGFDLYAMLLGYGGYRRNLNTSYYQINSTRKYSTVVVDGLPNGNPHPPLSTGSSQNDFQTSSWWIVGGGYLKVQNIALSYTLPQKFTKFIKMSEMKLLFYGTDLITFSKIKKSDPESLSAGVSDYPLFRTYALGVSISF